MCIITNFITFTVTSIVNHNLRQRYSVSNMSLVEYNKLFLNLTVDAPGNTHDVQFLRSARLFNNNNC